VAGRRRAGRGGGADGVGRSADDLFFDGFRSYAARAPAGLVRPGPPAPPAAIAAAEAALGRRLPAAYAAFLRSFDGAELFHEAIVVCGVGPQAARSLVDANGDGGPLVFAETAAGDRYLLGDDQDQPGPVFHVSADAEERWLAGSSFPRWLDALIAREALLYDPEGEFVLEAFEPDGEELTPVFALRQAERALRKDPDAAETHHALGVALRRAGKPARAREHFARAADLDPSNPWAWFDRGRAELAEAAPAEALASFRHAAAALPGPEGARFLVWAARAAQHAARPDDAAAARAEAQARDPGIKPALERAVAAAQEEGDNEAREDAEALVEALVPRKRLPVVGSGPRGR
jgi:tetratricopeptide (TPR) repeat protein